MVTGVTISAMSPEGVIGKTSLGEAWELSAASVVLVTHRQPEDALARQLRDRGIDVHVVGDALLPAMVSEAVFDGHRCAREIDGPHPDFPLAYARERPGRAD